jgi:biotin synthase
MESCLNDAPGFSAWLNRADKKELSGAIRYFCEKATTGERWAMNSFAREFRERYYGRKVYFRGLIEFSSYCRNDCYYCGLRKSNGNAGRYRLSVAEVLGCCEQGYDLGLRTFVLQSGEDLYYTDAKLASLITAIKRRFPGCAVTLSCGERSYEAYKQFFEAGADRYLLRHETADETHYAKLHPPELSLKNRKQCLYHLKEIGFQVGAGLMVGSPFQTFDTLAEDFLFLRELKPHMIGVGPFIPHRDTGFAGFYTPDSARTLIVLSLLRIMLPRILLPATTALGSVDPLGREKALSAGANVVMPNLSPLKRRADYALYDNKLYTGGEAAEHLPDLARQIAKLGLIPDFSRGDWAGFAKKRGDGS